MKQGLIYSFIFLLLFYQVKDGVIILGFKMNQDYIANNLCENRANSELKCRGNCVFMKAIKESHKQDHEFPALSLAGKFSFFISTQSLSQEFSIKNNTKINHTAFYLLKAYKSIEYSIFHPPQLS